MEAVEAETAPVAVGIVGVHGKLEENFRFLARVGGPQNKMATPFGGPAVAVDEFAVAILHPQRNLIVTALPVGRYGHLEPDWPLASMGGGILGDWVFGAADAELGENGFILGSTSRDLNAELSGAGRGVQLELLPGSVAKLAGIAFDEERAGFVGDKVAETGKQEDQNKKSFFHGAVSEGLLFQYLFKEEISDCPVLASPSLPQVESRVRTPNVSYL